jgi:hypothetical protein
LSCPGIRNGCISTAYCAALIMQHRTCHHDQTVLSEHCLPCDALTLL